MTMLASEGETPAETATESTDAAEVVAPPPPPEPVELEDPQIDSLGRAYATGRRKESVARVWIKRGAGQAVVNGKTLDERFPRLLHRMAVLSPMRDTQAEGRYDIKATVKGGGDTGQAGALRHGVARALLRYDPALRPLLRAGGHLTRDARVVERKKYGQPKARRRFQFSKR